MEKVDRDTKALGRDITQKSKINNNFHDKKIICWSYHNTKSEIYIAANGNISPCCWLGDLKIHEAKNIIKDYTKVNINHCDLKDILEGEFFKELANGIQGEKNAYRLQTCYHTCGVN